ncbi:MAG: class I SAM-dependent methyltransferase [Candidatus Woesebacteria bacterium]|nr:class I SAM-dependent methyltransferase [Candidatus Woesebacteria bacterium]
MDYELIDSGNGRRLEKFADYILDRPDPQIVWDKKLEKDEWNKADAVFTRTFNDKGKWVKNNPKMPDSWQITHNNLKFILKLTPFKHTGIFPEQSWQWDLISEKIKKEKREVNILNLFGYTGAATLAACRAGAKITHVDASKPAITWFRENQKLSGLMERPVRIIIDDCLKFTQREIKRGVTYDGIIMDPPVYGHGPNGETWKFNEDFPKLLENCIKLLSINPIFVICNAYAISTSSLTLANILKDKLANLDGKFSNGELMITEKSGGRTLSTGIWGMWSK